MSAEQKFEQDEVVWAKVRGWVDPWWPGVVGRVTASRGERGDNIQILVNFIGDNSHCYLAPSLVDKYQNRRQKEDSKSRDKKLKESIKIADRIYNKQSTYDQEVKRLAQEAVMTKMVAKAKQLNKNNSESDDSRRRSQRPKTRRQIQTQQDSSVESDVSKKVKVKADSKQHSQQKRSVGKIEELKPDSKVLLDLDLDYQNILSQLTSAKPDIQTFSIKLRKILNVISNQKPSVENILDILKTDSGKMLNTISKFLANKNDQFFEDNRSHNLKQLQKDVNQTLDQLKKCVLTYYFDCKEILTQLNSVTKSSDRKITKLIEKMRHQDDDFLDKEEEDGKVVIELESESESDESENKDQGGYQLDDEQFNNQQRVLRSKLRTNKSSQNEPAGRNRFSRERVGLKNSQKVTPNKVEKQDISSQQMEIEQPLVQQKMNVEPPKQIENPQMIADSSLRKKVCFKLVEILESQYKIDNKKAKDMTVKIESKARRLDPSMLKIYKSAIKNLITVLKNEALSERELNDFVEANEESKQIWEHINGKSQQISEGSKGLRSQAQEDKLD